MTAVTNGAPGPHAGWNAPSGVTRVVVTDYYDGAVAGLIQFGDGGPVFLFEMPGGDGDALLRPERTYELRPLPPDAVDRFAAAVAPYLTPRWPVWVPTWSFPTDEIRRAADAATAEVLAGAGPPEWTITTADYDTFSAFRAERRAVGSAP